MAWQAVINKMALAVHYGDYKPDTVTRSVTHDAKCVKMRKYRPREELGSSPSVVVAHFCGCFSCQLPHTKYFQKLLWLFTEVLL